MIHNLFDFYERKVQVLTDENGIVLQVLSGPETYKLYVGKDIISFDADINLK